MTDAPKPRSGSQKRRATEQIKINATPEQKAAIVAIASAYGQSAAALVLNKLLGTPLPRRRRPTINDKIMARYFAELAKAHDAIKAATAELGKSGSNLNQVAYYLNAGRSMAQLSNSLELALSEQIQSLAQLQEAVRDLQELRTLGMRALGQEPHRTTRNDD